MVGHKLTSIARRCRQRKVGTSAVVEKSVLQKSVAPLLLLYFVTVFCFAMPVAFRDVFGDDRAESKGGESKSSRESKARGGESKSGKRSTQPGRNGHGSRGTMTVRLSSATTINCVPLHGNHGCRPYTFGTTGITSWVDPFLSSTLLLSMPLSPTRTPLRTAGLLGDALVDKIVEMHESCSENKYDRQDDSPANGAVAAHGGESMTGKNASATPKEFVSFLRSWFAMHEAKKVSFGRLTNSCKSLEACHLGVGDNVNMQEK